MERKRIAGARGDERDGRCEVCSVHTLVHYDARFDCLVCDVCDAMLTIRDDEFRRAHPDQDPVIRAIWRDRTDPSKARAIGLRYYDIGYWDEQEEPLGYGFRKNGLKQSEDDVDSWFDEEG